MQGLRCETISEATLHGVPKHVRDDDAGGVDVEMLCVKQIGQSLDVIRHVGVGGHFAAAVLVQAVFRWFGAVSRQ